MKLILTEVTEMSPGSFCVAGWRPKTGRLVRPLPKGRYWRMADLLKHGIAPGAVVDFTKLRAANHSAFPHRTEDTRIDPANIAVESSAPNAWFGPLAPPCAATLDEAFEGRLQHNSLWNGAKRGVYVPVGTQARSLWGLKCQRASAVFFQDFDKDTKACKLKARVNDGNATYILPVTSHALKEAFRKGGVAAVDQCLPTRGPLHIRVGLSRAMDNGAKCYVMINGVYGEMTETDSRTIIYSVGHSIYTYEVFLALLRKAGVTAIADVRSSPYSRHHSQFNREALKVELTNDRIAYSYLGAELGGRPSHPQFYCDGVADYEKMATNGDFLAGVERLVAGSTKYKIAMMCSERDPLDCHRCLLIGRVLKASDKVIVQHILSDGEMMTQAAIEDRLLDMTNNAGDDLFISKAEQLANSYRIRARKVAFAEAGLSEREDPVAAE